MNITILDGYALNPGDMSWQGLEPYGNVTVYDRTPAELTVSRSADSEIIITNKVCFDETVMRQLPQLRCIVVSATGYNIIDTEAAARRGITVCNAPAYSTASVAQHVFALLLHMATHVADYARDNSQGRWSQSDDFCYISHPTIELAGKTIGIVGLGNIRSKVDGIAHAIGMRVVAMTSKTAAQLPGYITPVGLDQLLAAADVITLHCPLTPTTQGLINSQTISKMTRGAIVINTARGGAVCEADVRVALVSGRLAAYGADVLSNEPPAADNPLLNAPNAYITPHIAWATNEARQRLMDIVTENVKAFVKGRPINVVNKAGNQPS